MASPTEAYPFLSGKGSFQSRMIEYIKENWGAFLGEDATLLEAPGGLEIVRAKYFPRSVELSQVDVTENTPPNRHPRRISRSRRDRRSLGA
ncbi:hypothetical protein ACFL59_06370 [Planctomycetota bacterium]